MKTHKCKCGDKFEDKAALKSHQNYCSECDKNPPKWTIDKVECPDCGDMLAETQLERHRGSETCKAGGTFETLREESLSHYQNTSSSISDWKIGEDKYQCPECKEIYCKQGIGSHYWRNHTEEGKEHSPSDGREAWNRGLTKEIDNRVKKYGETFTRRVEQGKIDTSKFGGTNSEETAEKIRSTVKEKVKNNNWHNSVSKTQRYEYKDVILDSSWELAYAKWLDENNKQWERVDENFEYEFRGEIKNYTPDFYLPNPDKYIEIKGLVREKDKAKWRDFSEDLQVLKEKELDEMGIIESGRRFD